MTLRMFPLVAYLAAAAYLVCWLLSQQRMVYQSIRAWQLQRRKIFSMKAWSKVGADHGILIFLSGALFGGLLTLGLGPIFIQEWLLVIFVVLAVLSEELRVSPQEKQLLEVMVFFDRLSAQLVDYQDLFEVFTRVIQELPEGNVQKGVREAILRRRSGGSIENSLKAIHGIDPFLDEFVLSLRWEGWQNGSALRLILTRLLGRVGRRWDRTSRTLWIKDKSQPYLRFRQGALIAGLWVILIRYSSALAPVMPGRTVIVWSGLAFLSLGLVFYFVVSAQWLRRFLAVSIFILAFVSYANSLVVPIPSWIQVETISHRSDIMTDTGMVTSQMTTVRNERIDSVLPPGAFNTPLITDVASLTLTPIPTVLPSMPAIPSVFLSTPFVPEVFGPCCLHLYQPK